MRTWCVGGRAAPPRGGGSLAVCLLRPQVRRRRGTQSCSPWHRLLLGARGELLRKDVPERGRWREAAREHMGLIVGREGKGKQGKKTGNITSG